MKKKARKLKIQRESLIRLDQDDLSAVAGGAMVIEDQDQDQGREEAHGGSMFPPCTWPTTTITNTDM